jgi:hypothetical protein
MMTCVSVACSTHLKAARFRGFLTAKATHQRDRKNGLGYLDGSHFRPFLIEEKPTQSPLVRALTFAPPRSVTSSVTGAMAETG